MHEILSQYPPNTGKHQVLVPELPVTQQDRLVKFVGV